MPVGVFVWFRLQYNVTVLLTIRGWRPASSENLCFRIVKWHSEVCVPGSQAGADSRQVARFLYNLPGLLAGAMFVAQLPVCLCSEGAHSHSTERPACESHHSGHGCHDQPPVGAHPAHTSHGHHEHGSQQPTPGSQRAPCCPAPCQCAPANQGIAILCKCEVQVRSDSLFCWLAAVANTCLPSTDDGPEMQRAVGTVMPCTSASWGNPCALLCRWLC